MTKQTEATTEATKPPTIQQHLADLQQWCAQRGVSIVPVAQGVRTGAVVPIADFMPDTHLPRWTLQPAETGK